MARMAPRFSIVVDADRDLVRIDLGGFFESADIRAFVAALRDALRLLRCAPNRHLTLVDLRAVDIQPQESVEGFQQIVADPAIASRRLAFVVGRSLARRQVRRVASARPAAFFDDEAAAERWLFSDAPPPA